MAFDILPHRAATTIRPSRSSLAMPHCFVSHC